MTSHKIGRREFMIGAGGAASALALGGFAQTAAAETYDGIVAGAKKEGKLLWYDTLGGGQEALDAFRKVYPFIKEAKYIRVPGTQKVSRFVQESMAGGPASDLFNQGIAGNQRLVQQGLALPVDWKGLGIPEKLIGNDHLLLTMTVVFVIIYNTNLVKGKDIPRTFEDMLNPRFKGRTGKYGRAGAFDAVTTVWGEDKVLEYSRKYAKLNPRLTPGTAAVNQAVASGELLVGFTAYDSAVRLKRTGAPIDFHSPAPAVVTPLAALVAKHGANPNAAKLFLRWISTPEGAKAFEDNVLRGNALVEGTVANKLIAGKQVSYRKPEDTIANAKHINTYNKKIMEILKGRG